MISLKKKPMWLKISIFVLVMCWVGWLGGNWEDEFSPEYVPPKFEQLKKTQGVISFTRRSKSSGGEIEIHLGNKQILHLSCTRPYSLPSACYDKRINGKWESFRSDLLWKTVTVWWMPEKQNSQGEDMGRVYQLQFGDQLYFEYQEQLNYYLGYKQGNYGHNWYVGFVLLLLTIIVVLELAIRKPPPMNSDRAQ